MKKITPTKKNTRTASFTISFGGFSFLEVTVSLLLFGLIFTAVMQAIYTTGKIKESDARHAGNLRLLENIAVGLRTGHKLYDYGFRDREKERLQHFFEIENPGQEFYFNGDTSRLKLKRESSFRKIKNFMTKTTPKKEVQIFRQVIQPDPFLFRFRLQVKDPRDDTVSNLDTSVSYYLSRFYN